jgi:translation elongation factor EF-1beta
VGWADEGIGIKMLQVNLVIEDAKISLEELQEEIQEIEDYVQSTDVAGESFLQQGTLPTGWMTWSFG